MPLWPDYQLLDFGDGRKLERTLTGNSAHYVLDANGEPLDCLPGLYNSKRFLQWLETVDHLARAAGSPEGKKVRSDLLQSYHSQRLRAIAQDWQADLQSIDLQESFKKLALAQGAAAQPEFAVAPPAEAAAVIARPKMVVEIPIIRVVTMQVPKLEERTDDQMWEKIAALHTAETQLDTSSERLIRRQNPNAAMAGAIAITKRRVEDPLVRMLASLRSSIAMDTVRNEYQLHRKIHQWFLDETPTDADALNERVYAELFLTPSSDPWIGLVRPNTYTGLENGGIVQTRTE